MRPIKAIIAGVDGTLINTLYLIRRGQYTAVAEYMVERGIARNQIPSYEKYERLINKAVGGSTRDTLQKTLELLAGERHAPHLENINYEEIDRSLQPIQDQLALLYVHPFPGLAAMLTDMGEQNISLGIFTSSTNHQFVRNAGAAIPALGYGDLFTAARVSDVDKKAAIAARTEAIFSLPAVSIVTCDDVSQTKPNPEGVKALMEALGVAANEVVAIGDLDADIVAVRKAGVQAIGVSHGFGAVEDLEAAGAVRVVSGLPDVMRLVARHNSGQERLF